MESIFYFKCNIYVQVTYNAYVNIVMLFCPKFMHMPVALYIKEWPQDMKYILRTVVEPIMAIGTAVF